MVAGKFLELGKKYSPFLIGFLLFTYVVIRAIILPITHDESNTCLVYSTMPVIDIITYKIPIPNNHILNTLLIKLSTHLFGWSNLSVRLPNVLGFWIYYLSVFFLLKRLNRNYIFILFGLILMTFNPFLLDFFSMARGYALASSFMMASILFAVKYLEKDTFKNLTIVVAFAVLSVYTNFTLLNFYVAFIGLIFLLILSEHKSTQLTTILKKISIPFLFTLLLVAFSYIPIKKMIETNQFRFWKLGGIYSGTIKSLVISSSYRSSDFSLYMFAFTVITGIVFFIYSVIILKSFRKNKSLVIDKPYQLFFLLLTGTVLVNMGQFYITKTPYLSGRTALFFIPLFTLNMVGFVSYLMKHRIKLARMIMPIGMALESLLLFRAVNFSHCYEWEYDCNTYEVISFLDKEHKTNPGKTITLTTNWRFYPSFKFYIETDKLNWLKIEGFHNVIKPESQYEYYYTVADEVKHLELGYSPLLSFKSNERVLMKRK